MTIEAIVLDLDGVIRHFDPDHPGRVEARHGLPEGDALVDRFRLRSDQGRGHRPGDEADWTRLIGDAVGNVDAAEEWLAEPATTDQEVLAIVDGLRADGYPVSILTNGTDTVPAELDEAGIRDRFDHLFNTAAIGMAKPDPAIFQHVCQQLAMDPGSVFFTDDSPGHVEAAAGVGLVAHHFTGVAGLRAELDRIL